MKTHADRTTARAEETVRAKLAGGTIAKIKVDHATNGLTLVTEFLFTDGDELVAFMRRCNEMNWHTVITFHPPYTCERAMRSLGRNTD